MFKKILEMIGMNYDEKDEFEEEYYEPKKHVQIKSQPIETNINDENRKIVNIFGGARREEGGKMRVSSVSIIRPKTFEDSRLIADSIKEKKVVTFSLEFLGFEILKCAAISPAFISSFFNRSTICLRVSSLMALMREFIHLVI